jgi:uncharacterized membrane protein YedE/YeeE
VTVRTLAALGCGLVFGAGLALSGMTNPARVIAFLDVTGGAWDPTLALVMAAALAVATPGFALVLRRDRPVLDHIFRLPARAHIDAPLVAGAALFGVGWGLAGFCPGPALAGLVTGSTSVLVFLLAMLAGQALMARLVGR